MGRCGFFDDIEIDAAGRPRYIHYRELPTSEDAEECGRMLGEAYAFHQIAHSERGGVFDVLHREEGSVDMTQSAGTVGLPSYLHFGVLGEITAFNELSGILLRLNGKV